MDNIEPFGFVEFSFTKDQIVKLTEAYLVNGKGLRATMEVAVDYIFDKKDWLFVLDFLDKIQEVDRKGSDGIKPDDVLRQWIACALNPSLNPEWVKPGSSSDMPGVVNAVWIDLPPK